MMTKIALSFEFPDNLNVEKFITKLNKKIEYKLVSEHYMQKSFYDSFDWRLYNAHVLCEFNQSKNDSSLILKNSTTADNIALIKIDQVPCFANEFNRSALAYKLANLLEMRALLPLTTLELNVYKLNILNNDQKTVARLIIEDYWQFRCRVTIQPIKGYHKAAVNLHQLLVNSLSLTVIRKPILLAALKLQGRKVNDYSSKLNLQFDPDMPAGKAVKRIYKTLLKTIQINEQGVIDAIDSEFLHDFRVAIRRTRSGLSQLKRIFPSEITTYYSEYFAWLGSITSLTRDMNVYLLNIDAYKSSIPQYMREDLNPLEDFLLVKQKLAQEFLVEKLNSKKYKILLGEWEQYLKQFPAKETSPKKVLTIKQLADTQIWKVYQRVIQEGAVITKNTPAQSLHDLRKTCKKLRYLIEFFQNLYSINKIKALIKSLKGVQEVLGDFQDYEVQEDALRLFSDEMMRQQKVSSSTLLDMGVLVQKLDEKRCKARDEFARFFTEFNNPANKIIFKSLFAANSKKGK